MHFFKSRKIFIIGCTEPLLVKFADGGNKKKTAIPQIRNEVKEPKQELPWVIAYIYPSFHIMARHQLYYF